MQTSSDPLLLSRVNVAVVGLGFMGVTHLRAYLDHPLAKVVAVCDATRLPVNGILAGVAGNIQETADIHLGTDVKVYQKLEDLLADQDVQLVDLCTPTPLHHDQAIAALNAASTFSAKNRSHGLRWLQGRSSRCRPMRRDT